MNLKEATAMKQVTDILGIGVERKADFWWVVVEGKPSYPCKTRDEALEIVAELNRQRGRA